MKYTEYVKLVNTVKKHDYLYTVLNKPEISDAEYDRLYFQLQEYERDHPEDTVLDSPTQSIIFNKNGRRQVARRTTMLSTQKVKGYVEALPWAQKTAKKCKDDHFTLEWKYDGEPISLTYIDGHLVEAAVSKGATGSDVLQHVQYIESIPKTIGRKGRVDVYGEAVVQKGTHKLLGYDNERGCAHGLLAAEKAVPECVHIIFMPFLAEGEGFEQGQVADMIALHEEGFEYSLVVECDLSNMEDALLDFEQSRESMKVPTDGIVIKMRDRSKWKSMGATAHHPKYSAAYKFTPVYRGQSIVTRIEDSIGEKTGRITKLVYFESLTLNGGTFDHSGNDTANTLAKKGIEVGDTIEVVLRNDVIVYAERVIHKAE